jgi:hypothetical protein
MNAEAKMSGELSVRFVVRADYEQWLPLWDGYNAFYGRSGTTALSPEITRMTWTRFFAGAACRIIAGVLANPSNKPHRDAALRQGRGALRIRRVSQPALTELAPCAPTPARQVQNTPAGPKLDRPVDKSGCHWHVTKHG